MSLSSRRAWIEIRRLILKPPPTARRSPHGERGLKYILNHFVYPYYLCRSPHGERGLKYIKKRNKKIILESLSSRRAWIEIRDFCRKDRMEWSRSPHGERGLK